MWWAAATAVMGGTTGDIAMALRLAADSPLPKTAGSPHTLARPTILSEIRETLFEKFQISDFTLFLRQ